MKKVMIMGYDSYTDSSMRGKAVGAAVFSINDGLTKWYSRSKMHDNIDTESHNITDFFECTPPYFFSSPSQALALVKAHCGSTSP